MQKEMLKSDRTQSHLPTTRWEEWLKDFLKSITAEQRVKKKKLIDNLILKLHLSMQNNELNRYLFEWFKNFLITNRAKLGEESHFLDIEKLNEEHAQFAEEVFSYLLRFWGILLPGKVNVAKAEQSRYYENVVGSAILSLCMLYRDRWRETFREMREKLFQREHFAFYCCILLPRSNRLYGYYYLQRVAIIFEMALFCYGFGFDYFPLAQKVVRFIDVLLFKETGDWAKLKSTASLIEAATRPLRFIVSYPKYEFNGFEEAVKEEDEEKPALNYALKDSSDLHGCKHKHYDYVMEKIKDFVSKGRMKRASPLPVRPKYKLKSYADMIEKLDEFASRGRINITSRELSLLTELDMKVATNVSKEGNVSEGKNRISTEGRSEDKIEASNGEESARTLLMTFFEECLSVVNTIASTSTAPPASVAPTTSTAPPTSTVPPEPSTSTVPPEPSTSTVPHEPSTSTVPPEPSTSTVPPEPPMSTVPPEPSTSTVTFEPSTSTVPPEPPASTSEFKSTTLGENPKASEDIRPKDTLTDLDFWIDNAPQYEAIFELFRGMQCEDLDNDKMRELLTTVEQTMHKLGDKNCEPVKQGVKQTPKSRTTVARQGPALGKRPKYIPLQTDYVESVVELFAQTLASFLERNFGQCTQPCSGSSDGHQGFYCILSLQDFAGEILKVGPQQHLRSEGSLMPHANRRLMPLEALKALYECIYTDCYTVIQMGLDPRGTCFFTGLNVNKSADIPPRIDLNANFPVWFVYSVNEESRSKCPLRIYALPSFKGMFMTTKQFQGRTTAVVDDAALLLYQLTKDKDLRDLFESKRKKRQKQAAKKN